MANSGESSEYLGEKGTMRRTLFVCLVALVAAVAVFAGPASISTPAVWRYAHPQAKALVGIEWTRLANSPVGQQLRAKMGESGMPSVPGIELLDSIQSVFISSPGNPPGSTDEQPPAVIAVQGTFDLDQVRTLAAQSEARESEYDSIPLLENQTENGAPMVLALVSPEMLLLGDVDSVKAAIDHHDSADAGIMASPLYERARSLAQTNDVWLVSEVSPTDFTQAGEEAPPFLNDVESIEFGMSLQQGLGAELNLGAATAESAQSLAGGLQFMLAMLLSSQENSSAGAAISQKLQVSTDDTRVHLALQLSQDELTSAFNDVGSNLTFGGSDSDVAVRGTVQGSDSWSWEQEPKMPEDRTIRIWGAEEGPIEIPMDE